MANHRYLGGTSGLAEQIFIASGSTRGVSFDHKFGAVPQLSGSTTGTIWDVNDTIYPWSTWDTPGTLSIPVVNAADDGAIITIFGLDINGYLQNEQIVASDTTPPTGTKVFSRVFRALADGAFDSNTGDIDIQRGGTTVARISAGKSQTLMCVYTVPTGYIGYIDQGTASIQKNGDCTVDWKLRAPGAQTFHTKHSFELTGVGGPYTYNFTSPIAIPAGWDVDLRALNNTAPARVTAAFDIILIEDP